MKDAQIGRVSDVLVHRLFQVSMAHIARRAFVVMRRAVRVA